MVDTSIIGASCSDLTKLKLRSLTKVSSINAVCNNGSDTIATTKICKILIPRTKNYKKFLLVQIKFAVTAVVKI